jgi:hypothetical protein
VVRAKQNKEIKMNDIKGADLLLVNGFLLAAKIPEHREGLASECLKLMEMVRRQHEQTLEEFEELLEIWVGHLSKDQPSEQELESVLCDLIVRSLSFFPVELQAKTGTGGGLTSGDMWAVPRRITIEQVPIPPQNPRSSENSGTSPNLKLVEDPEYKEPRDRLSEDTPPGDTGQGDRMCATCGSCRADVRARAIEERQNCQKCNWLLR